MELIVVGFHRSGTSLLTQLLHSAGLFVGDELLDAHPSNPYGHFEDREVIRIHDQVLYRNGSGWQADRPQEYVIPPRHRKEMRDFVRRRQQRPGLWGFKDPRVCLFLGEWRALLPRAKWVVVYREPAECVRSLHARHAAYEFNGEGRTGVNMRFFTRPDHALRMWDTYNRAVLSFVRRYEADCLVLPYSHLPAGYPVIDRINDRLGTDLDALPTESVFDADVAGRATSPPWVHDPEVADRVAQTWDGLEEMARRTA